MTSTLFKVNDGLSLAVVCDEDDWGFSLEVRPVNGFADHVLRFSTAEERDYFAEKLYQIFADMEKRLKATHRQSKGWTK